VRRNKMNLRKEIRRILREQVSDVRALKSLRDHFELDDDLESLYDSIQAVGMSVSFFVDEVEDESLRILDVSTKNKINRINSIIIKMDELRERVETLLTDVNKDISSKIAHAEEQDRDWTREEELASGD